MLRIDLSRQSGQELPYARTVTIASLTGVLAEEGITLRGRPLRGSTTFSPYDGEPGTSIALSLNSPTSAIS